MSRRRILRADELSARALGAVSQSLSAIPVTNPSFSSGEISRFCVRLTHNFHRSHVRRATSSIVSHTRDRPTACVREPRRCVCPPRCDALRRNAVNLWPVLPPPERTVVRHGDGNNLESCIVEFFERTNERLRRGWSRTMFKVPYYENNKLAMLALMQALGIAGGNNWKVSAHLFRYAELACSRRDFVFQAAEPKTKPANNRRIRLTPIKPLPSPCFSYSA